jgi:ankyrin repeat protein
MKVIQQFLVFIGMLLTLSGCRESEDQSMLNLINLGDVNGLKNWNGSSQALNAHNANGWTPLMCAAEKGDLQLVKLLVEKGADLGVKDKQGFTVTERAESIVRRIWANTDENKRKFSEQLRRENVSEDVIQGQLCLIENSLPANLKDPQLLPKYQAVLDYLRAAHSSTNNLNRVK